MTPYAHLTPNYDKNFLKERKAQVREKMTAIMEKAVKLGILPENTVIEAKGASTR